MTRDCLCSPPTTTVGHATHAMDAGVQERQWVARPRALLGTHHDVWRLPPGTSQHRAAQNYQDAGLASAGTPTPQIQGMCHGRVEQFTDCRRRTCFPCSTGNYRTAWTAGTLGRGGSTKGLCVTGTGEGGGTGEDRASGPPTPGQACYHHPADGATGTWP